MEPDSAVTVAQRTKIWNRFYADDFRRDSLEVRKGTLQPISAKSGPGIRYNEHLELTARSSSPRLQDRTRRHRVEAEGLALSLGALAGLAENEER